MLPSIIQIVDLSGSCRPRPCSCSSCRFRWAYVGLWAASHFLRALGLTLTFHRYFAHRSFQMNRGARFVWTFIGTAAMQKGPIWWAGPSRESSQFADREGDPHSPMVSGVLLRAHRLVPARHASSISSKRNNPVVRDFSKAPEIALARAVLLHSAGAARRRALSHWRLAVARLGLLPADDDAGARDVCHQHRQPHVRVAAVRDASTNRATTRSPRSSPSAKGGTTTTTAISAPRETGSTGGSSIRRGTSSGSWRSLASRGTCSRFRRASTKKRAPPRAPDGPRRQSSSVPDGPALGLELADEAEPI